MLLNGYSSKQFRNFKTEIQKKLYKSNNKEINLGLVVSEEIYDTSFIESFNIALIPGMVLQAFLQSKV